MLRRWMTRAVLFFAVVGVLSSIRPWFQPGTYVSGWGATSPLPNKTASVQTVYFNGTVENEGHYPVYVKEVQAVFSEQVKSYYDSGDQSVPVGKWLIPGEKTEVQGMWQFRTTENADHNVMTVPNYATLQANCFPAWLCHKVQ